MATNKYLEKIAGASFLKGLSSGLKNTSELERVGLGMGVLGTSMSAANLKMGLTRDKRDVEKRDIESESLKALKGIHNELKKD